MLYDARLIGDLAAGLHALLPQWPTGPRARLELLTVSENATFRIRDPDAGDRIVRVYRPGYHSEAEIRSELAWTEALRADAVVTLPALIPARDGRTLLSFDDGGQARFAAAFTVLPGVEPDAQSDLPAWYRVLGEIAARLHDHSRTWVPPPGFTRKRWDFAHILGPGAHWGDWRAGIGLTGEGRQILERAHAELERRTEALGYGADRFGLIHCDMRAANLLVDGTRLGVIDFDDCGFCWFAYDFAAAVSFIEHEPIVPRLKAAWLDGYRRVAPFPVEQEAALPMLVMLRRMQLTAWLASHAETPTAQALGAGYTQGTVALATRFLEHDPIRLTQSARRML